MSLVIPTKTLMSVDAERKIPCNFLAVIKDLKTDTKTEIKVDGELTEELIT